MKHYLAEELRDEMGHGTPPAYSVSHTDVFHPPEGPEQGGADNSATTDVCHDLITPRLLSAREMLRRAADLSTETKAKDLVAIDVRSSSDMSDFLIVASGRSDRHVQGICNRIIEGMREHGISPQTIEGLEKGHWVVVDFGEVIIHVFYEPARAHYDIEGLWANAPRVNDLGSEVIAA